MIPKSLKTPIAAFALFSSLTLGANLFAQSTMSAPQSSSTMSSPKPMASSKAMPSSSDIADAKSKGMVWVNMNSKVYHKDDQFYGKTKNGQFMTEADAQKMGAHLAKASPIGNKKTAAPAGGAMAH